MIVYNKTKSEFKSDIFGGEIEAIVANMYTATTSRRASAKEQLSWRNSLGYVERVLDDAEIPDETGVAIEYHIPQSAKRIDVILTGYGSDMRPNAVIIELKQWEKSERTEMDAVVRTVFSGKLVETSHPSYQAWSYAALLRDFNEAVDQGEIKLAPCAFLHNYIADDVIRHPFYQEHLDKAPVFIRTEAKQLREFIKQYVKHGDRGELMYQIANGKIRPSRQLSDALAGMIKGNSEFLMIDDQKLVFEKVLHAIQNIDPGKKQVFIIEGGPGTGKSVVAINLLCNILASLGKNAMYVTKNAAPRAVYQAKLTGSMTKTRFGNLFKGSGAFTKSEANSFDALIVDEAHRLREKSGLYGNQGENQIMELIRAAQVSVFFVDDNQRVTLQDIGSIADIREWANFMHATVHEMTLSSQFRCNGSDGYLAWLDHALQIRETANEDLSGIEYDFKVFDDPNTLLNQIAQHNQLDNKSRMVSGYCWDWDSRKDSSKFDVVLPEFGFGMKWNLTQDGSLWILKENSINEIGCIHTCQGLELSYVGVIIGPDLVVRNGEVLVNPGARSKMDQSIRGYKKQLLESEKATQDQLRAIIKNTYRTLMTRGMKGCYIFATDPETREYFKMLSSGL